MDSWLPALPWNVIAHTPGESPSVETATALADPSSDARGVICASVAVPSGAVSHDTISSPGRNPVSETNRGVPTVAVAGRIVASTDGGSGGGFCAEGDSGTIGDGNG